MAASSNDIVPTLPVGATICCHNLALQKLTMGKDSKAQNITKEDADKLYSLFRKGPHKRGLNYNDTDAKYIRNEVFEKHFLTKKLDNIRTRPTA